MGRLARGIAVGVVHHVTQRGNGRLICPPSVPRLCVDSYLRYPWKSARFHSGLELVLMYGPPAEGVAKFSIIILSWLLSSDRHRQEC